MKPWFSALGHHGYGPTLAHGLDSQGIGRAHAGHHTQPGARGGAQRGDLVGDAPVVCFF